MFERTRIPVDICCNDPDNGQFNGRVAGIHVGENMSFEAARHEPYMRQRFDGKNCDRIILAGKRFPTLGCTEWMGNWCWNRYWMHGETVLSLLNWPRLRVWFSISDGETRLFNFWNSCSVWTDSDLRLIGKRFR